MMQFKILSLIGRAKEIDGMDFSLRCINKLLSNMNSTNKLEKKQNLTKVNKKMHNSDKYQILWIWQIYLQNMRKIKNFKDQEMLETEKIQQNIYMI